MKLFEAEAVADDPTNYTGSELSTALRRLRGTRSNGGVRNSERASVRLERRIAALQDELNHRAFSPK